jgi:urea transport system substrate-binding protein
LFGCWTSASRKAVLPVVEKHDQLLFYPTSYEGLESSPNIVYGGAVPNQQVLPALNYMHGFLNKKNWFLVGLDAVYSRSIHAVIQDEAKKAGCEVVGDEFILNDNSGIGDLTSKIEKADPKPDLIVNTIKGDTNVLLFRDVYRRLAKKTPILSFAVSESELAILTPEEREGHYAANTYFQSINSSCNRKLLKLAEKHFGEERPVTDQLQTSYVLVHMWALAAQTAGTVERKAVRAALNGIEYDAPEGLVKFDSTTQHLVQSTRLCRIGADGQFVEEFVSLNPIRPEPFPATRSRAQWEQFVDGLFIGWGRRWTKRG